ncbi:MAG: hypothetical protein ACQXXH_01690 [Candidatus Bathyarchaeia archaeon]|jgi:hypothetical protein|nr:hypothetical protein [Candidatus Bathyarchaeota archaeon A05DMB-4]MDH7564816.1 hypothetical protein [Candidatus Bathyarchaeota archaeon]
MSEFRIEKRKVITLRKKTNGKVYKQYILTIPKKFAEQHKLDSVYCVSNSIWIGVPDQETLMQILKHIPQIEQLLKRGNNQP